MLLRLSEEAEHTEEEVVPMRKIIHIDMDAFFASVEQRDNPELRGKPIAVGGGGNRGVVAAASYEARKFGVRSAMPSATAKKLCPDLIFVRHRFDAYKEASRQIMEIFKSYTDLVEPLSLDEAFLDVTTNKKEMPSATLIAQAIKAEIKEKTSLVASAGISVNKFFAKIASDMDKPDGLYLIPPEQVESFAEQLDVDKFHGIGKVTAARMKKLGIFTGADLKKRTLEELTDRFGKAGRWYYKIVRGIDNRKVSPDRTRKSVSAENTFIEDLYERSVMLEKLDKLCERVGRHLEKSNLGGRTITLKIKFKDFTTTTRSRTMTYFLETKEQLIPLVEELLENPSFPSNGVRLLGVGVSNLNNQDELPPGTQLTIRF